MHAFDSATMLAMAPGFVLLFAVGVWHAVTAAGAGRLNLTAMLLAAALGAAWIARHDGDTGITSLFLGVIALGLGCVVPLILRAIWRRT